jgi:hypothetical protein
MKPATDIFISSQQMVASIVVLPLMYGDQNLGGLYFTLETPSNFQNIKDMLMGFVNSIVLVLLQKLEGRLNHMWDAVVQVCLYRWQLIRVWVHKSTTSTLLWPRFVFVLLQWSPAMVARQVCLHDICPSHHTDNVNLLTCMTSPNTVVTLTRCWLLTPHSVTLLLLLPLQRPLAMTAGSTAGGGSMDARDLSALQHQQLAAAAADGGLAAAPDGAPAAAGSMAAGGGSMASEGDPGNAGVGGLMGVDGVGGGGGSMLTPPGGEGGGSMVVGDNSTGNVNKKLFVKRSCTEAMLKVGGDGGVFGCVRVCVWGGGGLH